MERSIETAAPHIYRVPYAIAGKTYNFTVLDGASSTSTCQVRLQSHQNDIEITRVHDCGGSSQGSLSFWVNKNLEIPAPYSIVLYKEGDENNPIVASSSTDCSAVFEGLAAGKYCYEVIGEGGEGCIKMNCIDIGGKIAIDATIDQELGNISLAATGGIEPYSFVWDGLLPGSDQTGLETGNYTVTVTDVVGCAQVVIYNVQRLACALVIDDETITKVKHGQDGAISVTINGGSGEYTFVWEDGNTNANRTNLATGLYTLTVTDAQNTSCQLITAYTLTACEDLEIIGTVTPITEEALGKIQLAPVLNVVNYDWGSLGTGQLVENLTFGTYTVTVTDKFGCEGTKQFLVDKELVDPPIEQFEILGAAIPNCDDCCYTWRLADSLDDGNIDLLELCIDEEGKYLTPIEDETFRLLVCPEGGTPKDYVLIVTDEQGNIRDQQSTPAIPYSNSPCDGLSVTIEATPTSFCENESVTLTATVSKSGDYTFIWSDGTMETEGKLTVTTHGIYGVLVRDETGCEATANITIDDLSTSENIKQFFVNNGFYRLPITILDEPVGLRNTTGNARNNNNICEGELTETVFSSEHVPMEFEVGNESITNLKTLLEDNISHFGNISGLASGKAFITANEDVCTCPNGDFLNKIEQLYNEESNEYALWIHLYQNENGEDCLFIQAKNQGGSHSPSGDLNATLNELLAGLEGNDFLADGFTSLAEQKLFTLQQALLAETLGDKFLDEPEVTTSQWMTIDASCMPPYNFLTSRGGILTIDPTVAATVTGFHIKEDILYHVLVDQIIYKVVYKNKRDIYSTRYQRTNIPLLVNMTGLKIDPNIDNTTVIFGNQDTDISYNYSAVTNFDQYVLASNYTDICDKIENVTIVKSDGSCGHPANCPGNNAIPVSDDLCDLLQGSTDINQTDIDEAAAALSTAIAARNQNNGEIRPIGKYHHLLASASSSMIMPDEKAKLLDEKLFLLQAHTDISFYVVYHNASGFISTEASNTFAKEVAEKAGLLDNGVLITIPYNSYVEVTDIKTCGQPGIYDPSGKVTNDGYTTEKNSVFEYILKAFTAIVKPVNICFITYLSDKSVVKFFQESKTPQAGYPFINAYYLFRSKHDGILNEFRETAPKLTAEEPTTTEIETYLAELAVWKNKLNALQLQAAVEEAKALNGEDNAKEIFEEEKGQIRLRESYMVDDIVQISYAIWHYDNNNDHFLATIRERYGAYPFDDTEHLHDEITLHQIAYNGIDLLSLTLAPTGLDFIGDLLGLTYTGIANRGATGKYVEYTAGIALPFIVQVASRGTWKGYRVVRSISESGQVEYKVIDEAVGLKTTDEWLFSIKAKSFGQAEEIMTANLAHIDGLIDSYYKKTIPTIFNAINPPNVPLTKEVADQLFATNKLFRENPDLLTDELAALLVKANAQRTDLLVILAKFEDEAKINRFTSDLLANSKLIDEFAGKPDLIRAWEVLNNADDNFVNAFRTDIATLTRLNEDLDRFPIAISYLKNNPSKIDEWFYLRTTYNSLGDPVKDVWGSGVISHTDEWNRIIGEVENAGGSFKWTEPDQLAYEPALRPGHPGRIFMNPDASITALRHEYQHFLDDQSVGFLGMPGLFDPNWRVTSEYNAYKLEIEAMLEIGENETAQSLKNNFLSEVNDIMSKFSGPDVPMDQAVLDLIDDLLNL